MFFSFINPIEDNKNMTNDILNSYEQSWGVTFPKLLREYYLNYNFSNVKRNKGKLRVSIILPLRNNNTWSVEEFRDSILNGEFVYHVNVREYIPFAAFEDYYAYFWCNSTGKVYTYDSLDDGELTEVFDSVEDFFNYLEEEVKKELKGGKKLFNFFKKG